MLLPLFIVCCFSAVIVGASADDNSSAVVLSSFHVSTHVNSRLMNTSINMVFANSANCSSVHAITLQLPKNARVVDLLMDLSDGCQLESQVKNLDAAIDDFKEFSSEGKPAALLTAWDMSNYNLQVSIPPNGKTNVLLQYEELLFQKLDKVSFQVPVFPGTAVGELKVDISVEEPNTGMVEFYTDDLLQDELIETIVEGKNAAAHYEQRGVTEDSSLPNLLQAYFMPGPLPETGLLLSDGECFTHLFNPTSFLSSVGSMARKIVFVIDISGSMYGQKLEDAKASFAVMIDTLDERDTLIVQPFSNEGTEDLWGPSLASTNAKEEAKRFVMELSTVGGTNLNQAFLDGIQNVYDVPETMAPILVMLTDGQGMLDGKEIARNVRVKNADGKVKIFALAFGNYADIDLLYGIAIQNGGRAVRIYEGFDDAVSQMELFFKEELGSVLLSDLQVSYDGLGGGITVLDHTTPMFPVLAAGSEIIVRGKMRSNTTTTTTTERTLKTLVVANSAAGPKQWSIDHVVLPDGDSTSASSSDCRQSYAQARIVELLEYRDAERALGNELFDEVGMSSRSSNLNEPSIMLFEEEARRIALDAHLVWPGLTALVTIENSSCQQQSTDICQSGNSLAGSPDDNSHAESYGGSGSSIYSSAGRLESAYCSSFLSEVMIIASFLIVAFVG